MLVLVSIQGDGVYMEPTGSLYSELYVLGLFSVSDGTSVGSLVGWLWL